MDLSLPPQPNARLGPNQRALWVFFCWHTPTEICEVIERIPNIHSEDIHRLYDILKSSELETPGFLYCQLIILTEEAAERTMAALEALDLKRRLPYFRTASESAKVVTQDEDIAAAKPYFYSPQREQLWCTVALLYEFGFIGKGRDEKVLEKVIDFRALQTIYHVEAELRRTTWEGRNGLGNPVHKFYHETSEPLVAQWLSRLLPLIRAGVFEFCIVKANAEHTVGAMIVQHDFCDGKHHSCCIRLEWREGIPAAS